MIDYTAALSSKNAPGQTRRPQLSKKLLRVGGIALCLLAVGLAIAAAAFVFWIAPGPDATTATRLANVIVGVPLLGLLPVIVIHGYRSMWEN